MCDAARVIHCLVFLAGMALSSRAGDWPQWAGSDAKNMVSQEKGLPESFVPGEKRPDGTIDLATARNVRWGVRVGSAVYSTPSVAEGKVFVGAMERGNGLMVCPEEATGKVLWKWKAPLKAGKTLEVLERINLGSRICASPVAANGTLYLATAGGWLWAVGKGK